MNEVNYPLSNAQTGILVEMLQYPDSVHYNLPGYSRIGLKVDFGRLKDAVSRFFAEHDFWKINIVRSGGGFRQVIKTDRRIEIADIRTTNANFQTVVKNFVRPFDVFSDPLARVGIILTEDDAYLMVDFSHLVCDGVTFRQYVNAIEKYYAGMEPAPEMMTIFDEALVQQQYHQSDQFKETEAFFSELVKDKDIRSIAPEPKNASGRSIEFKPHIPKKPVEDVCYQYNLRIAGFLNAAYCLLLSSATRSNDVGFTTIYHGRRRQTRDSYGAFISSLPFIKTIDPEQSVKDFVAGLGNDLMGLMRRVDYSYVDFVQSTNVFLESIFAYQGPTMIASFNLDGEVNHGVQPRCTGDTTAPLSLVVYDTDDGEYFEARVESSAARYSEDFLRDFADAYAQIAQNMVRNMESPIRDIEILDHVTAKALLEKGTEPCAPEDDAVSTLEAIERAAKANPSKTAIVSKGDSLTYSQLQNLSDSFAQEYLAQGLGKGDFVLIETRRDAATVARMLGAMKAGIAYVPIDPDYPAERIEFMRKDALSKGKASEAGGGTVYMIYTSGSTGNPKGVEISSRALWTFVKGIREVLHLSAEDRISCHSSFSFDASVEDIYPILTLGGTLFIMPEEIRRDVFGIRDYLEENRITGGNYTTRLGQMLMESCDLKTLRYIVLGGEKMEIWPERNRRVDTYNTYGPTEFTVDASWYKLEQGKTYENIPLGRPMPGQTIAVCDHHAHILPRSFSGEICLGGDQIASCYHSLGTFPVFEMYGKRFYRTGDIGYWNPGMELEYVSRDDGQCKINGFRIELSEVDRAVGSLAGVKEAKTIVNGSKDALICYVVTAPETQVGEFRALLRNHLPIYMIPRHFIRMDSLPLTSSGKLDVMNLPTISEEDEMKMVQSATEDEKILYETISQVLGRSDFGVTDDLNLLGISSLQIMECMFKCSERGLDINLTDFYSYPSIREILSGGSRAQEVSWYNSDESLPLMLFCSGITGKGELEPLLKKLAAHYHILLFPALKECESIEKTVGQYADIARNMGAGEPKVVAGHSFGGEIAYNLACLYPGLPDLFLFDTSKEIPSAIKTGKAEIFHLPSNLKLYISVHNSAALCGYRGRIVLVNALRRLDAYRGYIPGAEKTVSASANVAAWRSVHPSIEVLDKDAAHSDLAKFYDPALEP